METELEIALSPVGVVKSTIKTPVLRSSESGLELADKMETMRAHHRDVHEGVSELVIRSEFEELLDGIEDFSHLLVIYWPHLLDPERRRLKKVYPMGRKDMPLKGIFATRSPARPNPVLVSVVRFVERVGNVVTVKGLEAVDGSPLIDIKPHVQAYSGSGEPVVPPWMEKLHRDLEAPNSLGENGE